jgi:hypothetical protein
VTNPMTIAVGNPPTPINSLLIADDVAVFVNQLESLPVFKTLYTFGFQPCGSTPQMEYFDLRL